jgi:putative transposase
MKKLNKRKIRWIIRQMDKRDFGVYTIARIQSITKQHAYRVYKKYKKVKDPILLPCGRKPKEIPEEERTLVLETWKEHPLSACMLEAIIEEERGIHIPHNRIHKILKEEGLAKNELKKQKRRKWIRYERRHSLSLVHGDWFVINGKQIFLAIDDASRLLYAYGEFDRATTENSIKAVKNGIKQFGKPKQFHTDHGSQFVANEQKGKKQGVSQFTLFLQSLGIQHIKARIKHPQANGKNERVKQTIEKLWKHFGSLDKAVKYYNYKRPHMSLGNGKIKLETPYQAFVRKLRKKDRINFLKKK